LRVKKPEILSDYKLNRVKQSIANGTVLFLFFCNLSHGYVLNRNKRVPYTSSEKNFMHKVFLPSATFEKQLRFYRKKESNHVKNENCSLLGTDNVRGELS